MFFVSLRQILKTKKNEEENLMLFAVAIRSYERERTE